tara:strand:+ start:959 stop:1405 length:447 start_codon:yes stop_codon:yes gene_type:complete
MDLKKNKQLNNLFNHTTYSASETEELGIKFSNIIEKGDVVTLNGDLGSGKTTFVKGVLKGLNYTDEVTSPTFTLINEYNADYKIIHLDCFREKDINRWLNIGLIDYFSKDDIMFIEWPEIIHDILPKKKINLFFESISINERLIKYNG